MRKGRPVAGRPSALLPNRPSEMEAQGIEPWSESASENRVYVHRLDFLPFHRTGIEPACPEISPVLLSPRRGGAPRAASPTLRYGGDASGELPSPQVRQRAELGLRSQCQF
jgi:hypothetical protein